MHQIVQTIMCWIATLAFLQGQAQPEQVSVKSEIKSVLESQVAAWNAGDLEGFMNAYWNNDSLMFVSRKGLTYGWSRVLENYRKSYPDKQAMGYLEFGILRIELLSDHLVHLTGSWKINKSTDGPGGYFTLIFRKTAEGWKIIADHTS